MAARFFQQHRQAAADLRTVEGDPLVFEQALQADEARVLFRLGDLFGHPRARRTGTPGVFKGIGRGVAHGLDERERLFEISFRLAGKADDEVAGDGDVRPRRADAFDEADIVLGVVPAVHGLQHAVGPGLHGQVQIGHQFRLLAERGDQPVVHVARVGGGEADAFDAADHRQMAAQLA